MNKLHKKPKQIIIIIILLIISLCLIICGNVRMLNRPAKDYDEWNYVNVFKSVNNGSQLYKDIFFSQPPGFFAFVNPGFFFLGESLEAGRLMVLIWSFIGLAGILWLSFEMGNVWYGLLSIGILYLVPHYFIETVTLRADLLVAVFSVLAVASMIRFWKNNKKKYLLFSSIFFCCSFFTKLDFSTLFPLLVIYLCKEKEQRKEFCLSKSIIHFVRYFGATAIIFLIIFILFFDWKECINNVIIFGFRAMTGYPINYTSEINNKTIIYYLPASMLIALGIILGVYKIIKHKNNNHFNTLFIWSISALSMLIFYRPFASHQLVFSTIPFSMLISYFVVNLIKKFKSGHLFITIFIFFASFIYVVYSMTVVKGIITNWQKTGLNIILKNTSINDYLVVDDYALIALSGRKTIPLLADVSLVRIMSGDLSFDQIAAELKKYKPKLFMVWNERLIKIHYLDKLIKDYVLLNEIDGEHKVYIRLPGR